MTSHSGPKRVLIVDDSAIMCQVLTQRIIADPQLTVAGIAHNGQEAVRMSSELKPDVILMDIVMPFMDGLEATKQIMAYSPTPILIVASSLVQKGRNLAIEALSYGALHVIEKKDIETYDLTGQIKALADVRVISHPLAKFERLKLRKPLDKTITARGEAVVAIGASTGGPQALLTLLSELPKSFPCSLVIVQHISAGFTQGLADWMDRECEIHVKMAINGESLAAGTAYIAPTGVQMRLGLGVIRLTDEPPCGGHKPAATLLFESAAEIYGARAIGIILTGMGADGAVGLQKLHAASGKVLAQDEQSSVVFGMPKAAIDLGAADWVLPLDQMASKLMTLLNITVEAHS